MIAPVEIEEGLVARFDPAALLAHGAVCNQRPSIAVAGPHYFVCLGRAGAYSIWIPAFSRHRPGRHKVGYKGGHRDWVDQDSYVDLFQVWVVPDEALGVASQ